MSTNSNQHTRVNQGFQGSIGEQAPGIENTPHFWEDGSGQQVPLARNLATLKRIGPTSTKRGIDPIGSGPVFNNLEVEHMNTGCPEVATMGWETMPSSVREFDSMGWEDMFAGSLDLIVCDGKICSASLAKVTTSDIRQLVVHLLYKSSPVLFYSYAKNNTHNLTIIQDLY
ncbi:hypothetical protein OCU04_006778 [Sclerotinia nivalis]|uniref:Uncharacterized protein n=1 Tax=Sclerotinia nivalis TaxID=352851 RepID=A0A9X0DJ90_9HELO|nr:hypothetical protein OCU04_006778 [Sclerotinia nivalis]